MERHCPGCTPNTSVQNSWNSLDQDPHNAYRNACYHYQAYMYYWNIYNAHFRHDKERTALCECYDDIKMGQYGFPKTERTSRIPNQGSYHFTYHLRPDQSQTYFQDEGWVMDVEEEQTYDYNDAVNANDDGDDDEHDFELDERFCQFLRQSEKHRKEREREKRLNDELDEYIEAGKLHLNASTLPPQEQQGAKRKEAMRSLYGDKTQYIMSLEASLQLNYDRNFDTRQPKYWPNIPLKF